MAVFSCPEFTVVLSNVSGISLYELEVCSTIIIYLQSGSTIGIKYNNLYRAKCTFESFQEQLAQYAK